MRYLLVEENAKYVKKRELMDIAIQTTSLIHLDIYTYFQKYVTTAATKKRYVNGVKYN